MEKKNLELQKIIGRKFKQMRLLNNISQEQIAYALSLTRTSINNIESGRQTITPTVMWKSCFLFKCLPNDFYPSKSDLFIPTKDYNTKEFKQKSVDKRISQLEAKLKRLKEL